MRGCEVGGVGYTERENGVFTQPVGSKSKGRRWRRGGRVTGLPASRLDGNTGCPLPSPPARRVPSLPTSRTGLPDEAFESLTQLQHIYVAHNKVSTPLRPQPPHQTQESSGLL